MKYRITLRNEERIADDAELVKYMTYSRNPEGIYAIIALCDENGKELTDYSIPRMTKFFDFSEYLYNVYGIKRVFENNIQYCMINSNSLITISREILEVASELERGKFWICDKYGNICAGNSIAEILRNNENGIFEIFEDIKKIISEDWEYAETVLQSFPHFLAACKPIFDAVKEEKEK